MSNEHPSEHSPRDEKAMALHEHLEELRSGIVRSLLVLVAAGVAAYSWGDSLLRVLEAPLLRVLPDSEQALYFTGVADKFVVYLQVCLLSAFVAGSPYLAYEAWRFISPGLYPHERRALLPTMVVAAIAFIAGVVFCYFLVIPSAYEFLILFGGSSDKPIITIREYYGLTLKLLFVVGMVFETPVVLFALGKLGVVSVDQLQAHRKLAVLGSAVVAAILTPTPDAFTMLLVMGPLYLLFELGILALRIFEPKRLRG